VDKSVQLVNNSSQVLSTTVTIGCPEFSIVGNPVVFLPGLGYSTTLTLRYSPTIDNTAVGELNPSCYGTIALGAAIGPRLVMGTSTEVLRRRLDGSEDRELSFSSANHKDFAVDVANRDIYMAAQWTTGDTNDGIYRGTLDGIYSLWFATPNPWSVDYDPVANQIYWGADGTIRRVDPFFVFVETLPITFDPASPVDLVVDPQAKLLYWTEGTSPITIHRAGLDGQGEVILATIPGGGNPRLALDRAAGRLYWSEDTTGRIRRMYIDGTNVQTLLTPESVTPVAVAVDPVEGKVYWSDAGTGSVHRVDLGGENHEEIVTGVSGATGLTLIQPPVAETERVFWTDNTSDHVASVLKNGTDLQALVIDGLSDPRGMAVDNDAGKMYWVDQGWDVIMRADLDGSNVETLVSTGLVVPQDIALDLTAGKMYWTDSAFEGAVQIKRANLDGSGVENVYGSALWGVRGIAVDPVHGKMYWCEIEAGEPAIYRANLDGTGAVIFLNELTYPPLDLEIDVDGGKLYWTEGLPAVTGGTGGLVRRANLDATGVETLFSGAGSSTIAPSLCRSIALDLGARKVYWSSANTIRRRNLDGSGGGFGLTMAEYVVTAVDPGNVEGLAVAVRAGFPTPTDVEDRTTVAPRVHLEVPRPNPFNPSTTIAYTHGGGVLDVAIYDVRGRLVRALLSGPLAAGRGTITWDGKDDRGNASASGLYFVQMRSQEQVRTEKAVLVR
jgi:DNA-binding beta-propeller fold protein YncE